MNLKILYFGITAEITGKDSETITGAEDSDSINQKLIGLYPELKNANYRLAVNLEMINGNAVLKDGDEVALLPPFAGG